MIFFPGQLLAPQASDILIIILVLCICTLWLCTRHTYRYNTVHMYVYTLCFLTLYRRYDTGKKYYWQRQKELDTWARAFREDREPPLRNWLKTDNSVRDNVTFSHFIPLDAATWHSCYLSRCAGRIGSWQQKQNKIRDRPHGGMTSGTLSEMHLTPFHAVTYAQKCLTLQTSHIVW